MPILGPASADPSWPISKTSPIVRRRQTHLTSGYDTSSHPSSVASNRFQPTRPPVGSSLGHESLASYGLRAKSRSASPGKVKAERGEAIKGCSLIPLGNGPTALHVSACAQDLSSRGAAETYLPRAANLDLGVCHLTVFLVRADTVHSDLLSVSDVLTNGSKCRVHLADRRSPSGTDRRIARDHHQLQ